MSHTIESYRFMREHAGWRVGHNAEGALALAKAEQRLRAAVGHDRAEIIWEADDIPYSHGVLTDDEVAEMFQSGRWEGPFVCLLSLDGEVAASLSGIVVGPAGLSDPYVRVVEAELASEAPPST